MRDRRNMLGAAGIAVLVLGMTVVLTYMENRAAGGKPFEWSTPLVISGLGVAVIGLTVFGGVLWGYHVADQHRLKINGFIREGNEILMNLRTNPPPAGIHQRVHSWTKEVSRWLHTNMPHYEGVFESLADAETAVEGLATRKAAGLPFTAQAAALGGLESGHRARLLRLREIQMSL